MVKSHQPSARLSWMPRRNVVRARRSAHPRHVGHAGVLAERIAMPDVDRGASSGWQVLAFITWNRRVKVTPGTTLADVLPDQLAWADRKAPRSDSGVRSQTAPVAQGGVHAERRSARRWPDPRGPRRPTGNRRDGTEQADPACRLQHRPTRAPSDEGVDVVVIDLARGDRVSRSSRTSFLPGIGHASASVAEVGRERQHQDRSGRG